MAFLLAAVTIVRADISPTTFIGAGIAADDVTVVRMERADVEIIWGTPCSIQATFTMVNPTSTTELVDVCYPVPRDDGWSDFRAAAAPRVRFNEGEATLMPLDRADHHHRWKWFRCQYAFPPGTTKVVVETELRASLFYDWPGRETIHYCVESGGNWAGSIGEEIVTIRFPIPVADLWIEGSEPAEFVVEGDCVRWHWRDFNPRGPEHDVAFSYVRPDLLQTIARLRAELAAAPESSQAAVKLARHLLALGAGTSNSGFPPPRLAADEYSDILNRLPTWWKRHCLRREYRLGEDGNYEQKSWGLATRSGRRVVGLLAEIGYRDSRSRDPFVVEGESLLKSVLARDPHDAEAWNVYLASYWRFSYAAVGHWFGPVVLGRPQEDLIKTAARNCPADPCLRLWVRLISEDPSGENMATLHEEIERQGFLALEFPVIKYGYN